LLVRKYELEYHEPDIDAETRQNLTHAHKEAAKENQLFDGLLVLLLYAGNNKQHIRDRELYSSIKIKSGDIMNLPTQMKRKVDLFADWQLQTMKMIHSSHIQRRKEHCVLRT